MGTQFNAAKVPAARTGKRAKPRKAPKSPQTIAQAELKAGTISEVVYHRKRARIEHDECSWPWAFDIWAGYDRDYLGHFTGSGYRKVRCGHCDRRVPPQDVATRVVRVTSQIAIDTGEPIVIVERICNDCRIVARIPRRAREEATVRRVYLGSENGVEGIYELDLSEQLAELSDDRSPMTPALDALAATGMSITEISLPAEDDETLRAAVEEFQRTGSVEEFNRVTGDDEQADAEKESRR